MRSDRPSSTARIIAAATLLLAADRRTSCLVPPEAVVLSRQLLDTCRADRLLASSASQPFTRRLWRFVERCTHPGIIEHYWHRKRWIEARARAAVARGARRVIVIGAGLDTLACRLAGEGGDLQLIEIDHPATQALKVRALPDAGVRYVPLDIAGGSLPSGLIDDSTPTLVILEGVLMYLTPSAIDALLAALHALAAPRVEVIFSFMTRWPDGSTGFRPRSRLVDWWLRWRGEPFTWALAPESLAVYLAARGFELETLALDRDLTTAHAALEGENLAAALRRPLR